MWNQEANYDYYAHGPLARVITGNDSVDQCDYAYTIHGWIKGVKGQNFAYALGYYDNTTTAEKDYTPIGGTTGTDVGLQATAMRRSLYNGNISTMATHTPAFAQNDQETTFTKQFTYDQLNRIKTGTVINSTADAFSTTYSYDANGNIETLTRKDKNGVMFDEMAYHYHNVDEGYLRNTNRLRWVDDNKSTEGIHDADIEDQDRDNYTYDELGNLIADDAESIERIEWTVAGKVHAVIRESESDKPNLFFSYDAMGNRISKKSIDPTTGNVKTTYYIREASGNTMAVYQKTNTTDFAVTEHHIYGSSRLGLYRPNLQHITELSARVAQSNSYIGNRTYEFNDHLGNVHVVLSDRKATSLFSGNVKAAYEYYPFGMAMQTFESSQYRYGFNGMEKDDELKGSGNFYDLGMRCYDPRIVRMFQIDPRHKEYAWQTTYAYHRNSPISLIDFMGGGDGDKDEDSNGLTRINDGKETVDIFIVGLNENTSDESNNERTADRKIAQRIKEIEASSNGNIKVFYMGNWTPDSQDGNSKTPADVENEIKEYLHASNKSLGDVAIFAHGRSNPEQRMALSPGREADAIYPNRAGNETSAGVVNLIQFLDQNMSNKSALGVVTCFAYSTAPYLSSIMKNHPVYGANSSVPLSSSNFGDKNSENSRGYLKSSRRIQTFYKYKNGKVQGKSRGFPHGKPFRIRTLSKGIFFEDNLDPTKTKRASEY